MGKSTGFLEYPREVAGKQPIEERIQHYNEFNIPINRYRLQTQASRCMECGVPYCNWGCPINNLIPEFNDYAYQKECKSAYGTLQATNNFPEFTGRVCPAPCETACCAGLVEAPVTIKQVELSIIENAFENGWVKPVHSIDRSGTKVAVIGSGPSGLAAAQQLNLAGHAVTVFEKNEVLGGLLALGIPDFKLEKWVIDRRIKVLEAEGIVFKTGVHIGVNKSVDELNKEFDYICLTGGSEKPRDLPIPGREMPGTYFAMDFLRQQNRRVGERAVKEEDILATDKHVIVVGGGDTGSDCVGTSIRQNAKSVTQIEILPQPPEDLPLDDRWPNWPNIQRTSTSQEEAIHLAGKENRMYSVATKEITGNGKAEKIQCVKVEWIQDENKQWQMKEVAGSEFELEADLILLAMGFVHPVQEGMLKDLGVEFDNRGNVKVDDDFKTSIDNIFAAGDMAHGQSLVVRAIASGRKMAQALDKQIKGYSHLR